MKTYKKTRAAVRWGFRGFLTICLFAAAVITIHSCDDDYDPLVPLDDTSTTHSSPIPGYLSDIERDYVNALIEEYNAAIR